MGTVSGCRSSLEVSPGGVLPCNPRPSVLVPSRLEVSGLAWFPRCPLFPLHATSSPHTLAPEEQHQGGNDPP